MQNSIHDNWRHIQNMQQQKIVLAENFLQKIVYYIIGLEVFVCGYILANPGLFGELSWLLPGTYFIGGIATFSGLYWRWTSVAMDIQRAYNENTWWSAAQKQTVAIAHWVFLISTVLLLLLLLGGGTFYLYKFKNFT